MSAEDAVEEEVRGLVKSAERSAYAMKHVKRNFMLSMPTITLLGAVWVGTRERSLAAGLRRAPFIFLGSGIFSMCFIVPNMMMTIFTDWSDRWRFSLSGAVVGLSLGPHVPQLAAKGAARALLVPGLGFGAMGFLGTLGYEAVLSAALGKTDEQIAAEQKAAREKVYDFPTWFPVQQLTREEGLRRKQMHKMGYATNTQGRLPDNVIMRAPNNPLDAAAAAAVADSPNGRPQERRG